jgi:hypothetical protein
MNEAVQPKEEEESCFIVSDFTSKIMYILRALFQDVTDLLMGWELKENYMF